MLISGVTPQLRTRDLDASIRFYTEKVGLTLEFRHSDFYAGIRAGDQVFHLKHVDSTDPSIGPEYGRIRQWQTKLDNHAARALYDKVAQHTGFIVYAKELTAGA
jgi:catechol 2,3-dioxygenase-like lactoylglutathione lyase family enzyme